MKYYGLHEFPQKLYANESTIEKASCLKSLRIPNVPPTDFTNTSDFGFIQCNFDKLEYKDYNQKYITLLDKYNSDYILSAIYSEYIANILSPNAKLGVYHDASNLTFFESFNQLSENIPCKNANLKFKIINGTNSSSKLDTTEAATFLDATIIIDTTTLANTLQITIDEASNILNKLYNILPEYKNYNIPVSVSFIDKRFNQEIFKFTIDIINQVFINKQSLSNSLEVYLNNITEKQTNYSQLDNYLDATRNYIIGDIIDITTDLNIIFNIFSQEQISNLSSEEEKNWSTNNFKTISHYHNIEDIKDLTQNKLNGFLRLNPTEYKLELNNLSFQTISNLKSIQFINQSNNILLYEFPFEKENILTNIIGIDNNYIPSFPIYLKDLNVQEVSQANYIEQDTTINGTVYVNKQYKDYNIQISGQLNISFNNNIFNIISLNENIIDTTNYQTKYLQLGIEIDLKTLTPKFTYKQEDKTVFDDSTSYQYIDISILNTSGLRNIENKIVYQLKGLNINIIQPSPETAPSVNIQYIQNIFSLFKKYDKGILLYIPEFVYIPPGELETIIKFPEGKNIYNFALYYINGLSSSNSINVSYIYKTNSYNIKQLKENSSQITLSSALLGNGIFENPYSSNSQYTAKINENTVYKIKLDTPESNGVIIGFIQ